jgi:hypothetical protein
MTDNSAQPSFNDLVGLINSSNNQIDWYNRHIDNFNKHIETANNHINNIIDFLRQRSEAVGEDDEETLTDIDGYETASLIEGEDYGEGEGAHFHNCQFCDFSTRHKQYMKNHILHKHNDTRKFGCGFEGCDKFFKTKKCLAQHQYTHKTTKKKCDHCEKEYQHPSGLYAHRKKIHKNQHQPINHSF